MSSSPKDLPQLLLVQAVQTRGQDARPVFIWICHISFSCGRSPPGEHPASVCWYERHEDSEKGCGEGTFWWMTHCSRSDISSPASQPCFSPKIPFPSPPENMVVILQSVKIKLPLDPFKGRSQSDRWGAFIPAPTPHLQPQAFAKRGEVAQRNLFPTSRGARLRTTSPDSAEAPREERSWSLV